MCHRSGGPADFIRDGVDGLLVDDLDAKTYAEAVGRAIAKPAVLNSLSANARISAKDWAPDVVLDRLESELIQACADRAGSGAK